MEIHVLLQQAICLKNVCKNGGSCVVAPGDEDGVQCTCPEKFTGKFCEKVSGMNELISLLPHPQVTMLKKLNFNCNCI